MTVSLIVAASDNGVIGRDGALPWHLSADLRRFRLLTTGHSIIMGRRTHESIGRLLPERRNIVLSRQTGYTVAGGEVCRSVAEALARCRGEAEVFVIGGQQVYEAALPMADRVYLTEVHLTVEGDARMPELAAGQWREVSREDHAEPMAHSFVVLQRVRKSEPGVPYRPRAGTCEH